MGVEIAPHPVQRLAFEIAPVIFVAETAGSDAGAGRIAAQFSLLSRGEGAVHRREFVILVFAHGESGARGSKSEGYFHFAAFIRHLAKVSSMLLHPGR